MANHIGDDSLLEIISYLDAVSIANFASCSKRLWTISSKPLYIVRTQPFTKHILYKQWNKGLIESVKKDNLIQIEFFLLKGADRFEGLSTASFVGNKKLMEYFALIGHSNVNSVDATTLFLESGDIFRLIHSACAGGRLEIVNWFLSALADDGQVVSDTQWLGMTNSAIEGGNNDIIQKFIFDKFTKYRNPARQQLFESAVRGGHIELVETFGKQTQDISPRLLYVAAQTNMQVVNWFVDNVPKLDWNLGLAGAAKSGKMDLVEFFIQKGATQWNRALTEASFGGHLELVCHFLDMGATEINAALVDACLEDQREVIELLIEKGANEWNDSLVAAAGGGHIGLVEFLIRKGATKFDEALQAAGKHTRIVELLFSKGFFNEE